MARARLVALLATLTIAGMATAQPPVAGAFTIESRRLRYAGDAAPEAHGDQRFPSADDIVMPWVRGGPAGAATRINELVFLHELQLPAPREAGATFTPDAVESLDGFSHVRFEVLRDDARVLTLAMDVEQCGNRCNLVGDTLLFDARTGHRLLLSDLVTPAGRASLLQRRKQVAIEAYQRAIDALPAPPAAKDADDDDVPAAEPPPPERRPGAGEPAFTGWGQVLHGRLGKDAVTLYMDEPTSGWSSGTYVHDRIGRPIAVTGPAKGDTVEPGEDGGKGFALRRVDGALVGTWKDKDQVLPVRLR